MSWSRVASAVVSVMMVYTIATPPNAPAMSCAGVLVVDGWVLLGISIEDAGGRLPARGRLLRAIEPACEEDEKARGVSVTALDGMPVRLAVAPERDNTTVYVAEGSLVALGNHPLHDAWYADSSRPSLRGGRSCAETGSLTGTVVRPADFTWLQLKTRDGERTVRVDSSSRTTNRPAYQPVLPGQRLQLRMVKCGRHRVADRIRFTGATISPRRSGIGQESGAGALPVLVAAAAAALIGIRLIFKFT